MKIGVFADTHDHLDHIRLLVERFNAEDCELAVFAGDFVSSFALPPLRQLKCPIVACWGDNEGNRRGVEAGMRILGVIGEPPFCHVTVDGTRILLTHMRRSATGSSGDTASDVGEFDLAVYAHTHRAKISRDDRERYWLNPGEASGWSFGIPTAAIVETNPWHIRVIDLRTGEVVSHI